MLEVISAQPQPSTSTLPAWRATAELAQHEMDPVRLSELVERLLRELDEERGRR